MRTRLREFRKKKKLSQSDLAELAGVNQSYISKLEKGGEKLEGVTLGVVLRLAKLLDCAPLELLNLVSAGEEDVMVMGRTGVGTWNETPFWKPEHHYTVKVAPDPRFPGIPRLGIEVPSEDGKSVPIASWVGVKDLPQPLEIGKEYLVQRTNAAGAYELTIRRLSAAPDGSQWLELCYAGQVANPALAAPIPYDENDPTIEIAGRITSLTMYK
jgi:transcriptional regulator with XRE-family HTH domain